MPADGQIASTTEPLTREITFEEGCCVLTSLTVTAHQSESQGAGQTGTLTIRALDANGQQIGDSIVRDLNYFDGCVTIATGWTACHTAGDRRSTN